MSNCTERSSARWRSSSASCRSTLFAAEEVALLVEKHSFGSGIDGGDDAGFVGDDDAKGRAGDDGLVEVEGALEVFLMMIVSGDVGDRGRDAVG